MSQPIVRTPFPASRGELRAAALAALGVADPLEKVAAVQALRDSGLPVDTEVDIALDAAIPGRPPRPRLVPFAQVPNRKRLDVGGRAALIHALAHIEFNAINLALDAIWRFKSLPPAYYTDWLRVAAEEAVHFTLLRGRLLSLGHDYGDFDAHDGLWQAAERTASNALARMAWVPRTLEARGLDVSPRIRDRLRAAGDHETAAIVERILVDEIGHVAVGNSWYHHLCRVTHLDPRLAYRNLAAQENAPQQRGPFNLAARRMAGFTEDELDWLIAQAR